MVDTVETVVVDIVVVVLTTAEVEVALERSASAAMSLFSAEVGSKEFWEAEETGDGIFKCFKSVEFFALLKLLARSFTSSDFLNRSQLRDSMDSVGDWESDI